MNVNHSRRIGWIGHDHLGLTRAHLENLKNKKTLKTNIFVISFCLFSLLGRLKAHFKLFCCMGWSE